ncbi:hypothetical protein E2320_008207, partial [Naja naja]
EFRQGRRGPSGGAERKGFNPARPRAAQLSPSLAGGGTEGGVLARWRARGVSFTSPSSAAFELGAAAVRARLAERERGSLLAPSLPRQIL